MSKKKETSFRSPFNNKHLCVASSISSNPKWNSQLIIYEYIRKS